ncbi:MAG: NUDIX domain-containing protein [bacterium]
MPQEQFISIRAIITYGNKILLVRESKDYTDGTNPGKWDVPAGRVSLGEKPYDALQREVKEEVGLDIEVGRPVWVDDFRPTIEGFTRHIVVVYVACSSKSDKVVLSEVHDGFKWLTKAEAVKLPLMDSVARALAALD